MITTGGVVKLRLSEMTAQNIAELATHNQIILDSYCDAFERRLAQILDERFALLASHEGEEFAHKECAHCLTHPNWSHPTSSSGKDAQLIRFLQDKGLSKETLANLTEKLIHIDNQRHEHLAVQMREHRLNVLRKAKMTVTAFELRRRRMFEARIKIFKEIQDFRLVRKRAAFEAEDARTLAVIECLLTADQPHLIKSVIKAHEKSRESIFSKLQQSSLITSAKNIKEIHAMTYAFLPK